MSQLSDYDIKLNLAAYAFQPTEGAFKVGDDLDRYRRVIAATRPNFLVETGTQTGSSARWFAENGIETVVTIDAFEAHRRHELDHERVTYILGDSKDTGVVDRVKRMAEGRQVMVSLDSDHTAPHVIREIELYGPLVSPGCYLVVEDGILRWMPPSWGYSLSNPLTAIEETLLKNPNGFTRDVAIESIHSVTMFPAGWWRKDV